MVFGIKLSPKGVNWGVQDPEIDALIQKILVTFDRKEQDELMRKAHQMVVDKAYWLYVVYDINVHALSPRVKGFKPAISWNLDSELRAPRPKRERGQFLPLGCPSRAARISTPAVGSRNRPGAGADRERSRRERGRARSTGSDRPEVRRQAVLAAEHTSLEWQSVEAKALSSTRSGR
jgi:hypothetical protein